MTLLPENVLAAQGGRGYNDTDDITVMSSRTGGSDAVEPARSPAAGPVCGSLLKLYIDLWLYDVWTRLINVSYYQQFVCCHSWCDQFMISWINTESLIVESLCGCSFSLCSLWMTWPVVKMRSMYLIYIDHISVTMLGSGRGSDRTVDWSEINRLLLWCDVMWSQTCRWVCSGRSWRHAAPCWRSSEPAAGTSPMRTGTEQTVLTHTAPRDTRGGFLLADAAAVGTHQSDKTFITLILHLSLLQNNDLIFKMFSRSLWCSDRVDPHQWSVRVRVNNYTHL